MFIDSQSNPNMFNQLFTMSKKTIRLYFSNLKNLPYQPNNLPNTLVMLSTIFPPSGPIDPMIPLTPFETTPWTPPKTTFERPFATPPTGFETTLVSEN